MTDHISRGDAVVQVETATVQITAYDAATTYTLTCNGKAISVAGDTDADGTATALADAVTANADSIPEFDEVTVAVSTDTITITGPSNGKPFTITASKSGGTGTIGSVTTVNAAKSPNHWIAENFSSGSLPGDSDNVYIQGTNKSLKWGLDQNTVTLGLLDIRADFSNGAEIGLPELNNDGTTYYEYRDTHLKISAAKLVIGTGSGQGSGRIKIDTGSNACAATIYKTGTPTDQDEAAVHLVGSHASNSLQLFAGKVDIAMLPGYTAQWPTLVASGGTLRCGEGVTLGEVQAAGNSTVETRSAITTASTRDSGTLTHIGDGGITTLNVAGGTVKIRATGALTIGTLNGYAGRTLDLSECDSVVTISAMTIYGTPESPFTINDPNNKLTMTAAASTPNGAQSLEVVSGPGRNVKVS